MTSLDELQQQGSRLLHQQCWNWGRDVIRSEGNLLLEAGFVRERPPEDEEGATRYILDTPDGCCLILWGFGIFFGGKSGGIYLGRYQFDPQWTSLEAIRKPIWKPDMIPAPESPPSSRAPLELMLGVAGRIADYEEWVLSEYGLPYRCEVLSEWKHAHKGLAPESLPTAWRELAGALDERLQTAPAGSIQ